MYVRGTTSSFLLILFVFVHKPWQHDSCNYFPLLLCLRKGLLDEKKCFLQQFSDRPKLAYWLAKLSPSLFIPYFYSKMGRAGWNLCKHLYSAPYPPPVAFLPHNLKTGLYTVLQLWVATLIRTQIVSFLIAEVNNDHELDYERDKDTLLVK